MKRFLQTREVDLPPLNQTHAEILLRNLDLELQKEEATFGVSQDHLLEIQKIKDDILKAKRLNTVLKRKLKFAQSEVQRFSLQNEKLNSQVNTIIASGNYQALPSGNDPAAGAGSPGWSTAIIFVVGVLALSTFQKRLMSKK
jgi:hypothetical protein